VSNSPTRSVTTALTRVLIVIEEWLPAALLAVMTLAIAADVLMRYAFNHPLAWAGPLSVFSMVWLVYLGSAAVSRKGSHICLDFLSERIGSRGRAILDIFVELFTGALLTVVLIATLNYLSAAKFVPLVGLGISKRMVTLAAAIGIGLMILHALTHLWRALVGLRSDDYQRVNIPVEQVELDEFDTQVIRTVDEELTGGREARP
jgi:TRAP-type C4-dicarboxylate transport system permease small subunit